MEITIHSCKELNKLNSLFSSIKNLKLNLPSLTKEENEVFSKKLNTQLNACGCEIGKKFVIYTLIGCIICSFLKLPPFNHFFWSIIPITILSAVIGKLFGLFFARIRIIEITRQIKQRTANGLIELGLDGSINPS